MEAVQRANLWEGRGDFSNYVLLPARYRFNRGATRERNEKLLMRCFINKIIITISGRILQRRASCNDAREMHGVPLAMAIWLSRDRVSSVVESRGINVKPF